LAFDPHQQATESSERQRRFRDNHGDTQFLEQRVRVLGAVIVSTTVQNTDKDGLLDVWKDRIRPTGPDIAMLLSTEGMQSQDAAWVDLPERNWGQF
jgi:hypothetical protein